MGNSSTSTQDYDVFFSKRSDKNSISIILKYCLVLDSTYSQIMQQTLAGQKNIYIYIYILIFIPRYQILWTATNKMQERYYIVLFLMLFCVNYSVWFLLTRKQMYSGQNVEGGFSGIQWHAAYFYIYILFPLFISFVPSLHSQNKTSIRHDRVNRMDGLFHHVMFFHAR